MKKIHGIMYAGCSILVLIGYLTKAPMELQLLLMYGGITNLISSGD